MPRAKLDHAVVALLFVAGFAFVFRRWLFTGFDGIFGDDADGELLIAILEHWHHVFAGTAHWPDPSFFYPERGTLGFTDALFLYGVVHAALRALGFDAFTAFMILMAALAAIGFFGFIRLARRHFGLGLPWAGVGAFLFVFANMDAVKLIHAQAYCAMLLPIVCDLVLTAWRESRVWRAVALAAAAGLLHGLIFITAYQTAWFFTVFLMLFALLHPFAFGPRASLALLREAVTAKRHVAIAYAVAFAVGLIPFLKLYLPVLLSGRHRDLAEIISNSPDARDILNVTTGNWMWGEILRWLTITGRPNRPWWEVELGYTPVVFALLLATTLVLVASIRGGRERSGARDRWLLLLALGVLLSWLVQLDYFGFRPWAVIWALVPGAGGVRYTFRSQIVANLFAALVVARGLEGFGAWLRERRLPVALVAGLIGFILVEQVNLTWPATFSRREITAWIDAVPPPPAPCQVFYLAPRSAPVDRAGWIHQEQAALFSQIRNMPTINGYSSWLPEGWDLEEPNAPGYPAAVRDWAARKNLTGLCGLDPLSGKWTIGLP
jgi:hypothetical protein